MDEESHKKIRDTNNRYNKIVTQLDKYAYYLLKNM